MTSAVREGLLDRVAVSVREADVFASVSVDGGRLICRPRDVDEAEYRLDWDDSGGLWVSLVTPDRWLSGSIEGDLVHTGDKMDELVTDELVELGCDEPAGTVEHFRSEDMLFTFRTRVPVENKDEAAAEKTASAFVLGYEACFRQLGDMSGETED